MMLRRSDAENHHNQHVSLKQDLDKLGSALAGLVCYAEVFADLGSIEQVRTCVRKLREDVPTHFAHEEQKILAPAAGLSPQWQVFVTEMRRQHLDMQRQLDSLCALAEAKDADDLEGFVRKLKEEGEQFTRHVLAHMGAEDRKLSTITTNA